MKYCLLLIFWIVALALAYPIHTAENEADIEGFNKRHTQDTSVLYFLNLSAKDEGGFWASLFSLFGSSSTEGDETYLNDIARNAPVLKIDVGQTSLEHSAEDYKVDTLPFVIVFHKGEEIFRETPNSGTDDKIEDKIKEKEEKALHAVNPKMTVHPERDPSKVDVNDEKTETDVHHHPKPLTIIPDFGHMSSTNNPAESDLISAKPIQDLDEKSHINDSPKKPAPATYTHGEDALVKYKRIGEDVYNDPKAAAQKYGQTAIQGAIASRMGSGTAQPAPVAPRTNAVASGAVSHYGQRRVPHRRA